MTTTKSPPSTCGANVGLCLPRSRVAIWTASRPSTTSVASITCHSRVTSAGFGLYVRTVVDLRFSEVDKTRTGTSASGPQHTGEDLERTTAAQNTGADTPGSK